MHGNYKAHSDTKTANEFGEWGANFNKMADAIVPDLSLLSGPDSKKTVKIE